jgi:ribosomal protein S14
MEGQLVGGLDYASRQMCLSFYDVPCVFSKENFNQGDWCRHVISRPRGCHSKQLALCRHPIRLLPTRAGAGLLPTFRRPINRHGLFSRT